jgi:putative protease
MKFLHAHNVRGYLTLNILVFPEELAEAERFLRVAESAGVDAVLVQDLGIVRLARATAPNLAVHASTQMTITSPEGIHFAKSLGIERVVVARELSLRELVKFREDDPDMLPVETFVHGALCVAYSGQCLTSESLGQRSANRGECAQACRLPYELIVDGEKRDMGDKRYLLSPQDLAAIDDIPALIDAGICSFKIEGRLKTPEYVAAVTQVYRKAIDRALGDRPNFRVLDEDRYKLEMTFSRGLFSGWMHGVDHQQLVHARYGKKRGPFAGTIAAVGKDHVEFAPKVELKPGDGIVFDTGGNPDDEQGGRIFEIRGDRYFFQRQKIDFNRLKPGVRVWKTSDPALERELRKSFAAEIPVPGREISCVVSGTVGSPLRVEVCCGGTIVAAESTMMLDQARARALSEETMREHFGRLGGSGFSLTHFSNEVRGDVFLPVSELNEMRRRCIAALDEQLAQGEIEAPVSPEPVLAHFLDRISARRSPPSSDTIELSVLCRTPEHIQAALDCGIQTIHVDYEDIRRYPDAVALVRSRPDARIFLATPRIQKAGEQGFFKLIENAGSDGVLIRNLGGLAHFKDSPLRKVGDQLKKDMNYLMC